VCATRGTPSAAAPQLILAASLNYLPLPQKDVKGSSLIKWAASLGGKFLLILHTKYSNLISVVLLFWARGSAVG
jgi:hypothetical protein